MVCLLKHNALGAPSPILSPASVASLKEAASGIQTKKTILFDQEGKWLGTCNIHFCLFLKISGTEDHISRLCVSSEALPSASVLGNTLTEVAAIL